MPTYACKIPEYDKIADLLNSVAQTCWAQGTTSYTDPMTNITFATFDPELETADGFWQFGMVLPQTALTTDFYDYIGILVRKNVPWSVATCN